MVVANNKVIFHFNNSEEYHFTTATTEKEIRKSFANNTIKIREENCIKIINLKNVNTVTFIENYNKSNNQPTPKK